MTVNESSILCFKRETTAGTAIITAADSTTSEFGGYEEEFKQLEPGIPENEITSYHNYSSRKPNLQYGNKNYPEFKTQFNPCSPLAYYQFLGYGNSGAPSTVTLRETGKKDSYTIRHEEREGTNQLIQNVGCYNIGIYGKAEMNKDEMVQQTWAYQSLEDNGDRVSLTTLPTLPESISSVFTGIPEITWDVGGGGEAALPECYRAEWSQGQEYSIVKTGTTYTINLHEYQPGNLTLVGILGSNTQWDALKDQTTHEIDVKTYKQNDLTKYKIMKFYGCKLKSYKKLGKIEEGAYLTTMQFEFTYFDVNFISEFGANFTTWFVNAAP